MRLLVLLLFAFVLQTEQRCTRRPHEAKGDQSPGNHGYVVEVSGATPKAEEDPEHFIPGESYRISLRGWRTQYTVQTFRGFVLTAHMEKDGKEVPAGQFQIVRGSDARVAPGCREAGVSHSNLRVKVSVHVQWKAPETASGCVIFRASVIENKYNWYADEGQLTKKLCLKAGYAKVLPDDNPMAECCACDQAKYELEFTGIWSKDTHPKDYPTLLHLTHFTDMLGASHSSNYSLWNIGELSSDGMKEIAEWGNTYKAEQEAKEKAAEVRTLMKIKGLWYPEVQGTTKSHFVVNKYHHLMSFGTMFGPSPDWCVGLSSVNLCLPDCSWVSERTFDLLPFDAGTDDGPTYMSPNTPAEPRHPIRWITTKDVGSPFYDPNSDSIPTMARVVLRRTDILPKTCQTNEEYKKEAFNITNTSEDEEYKDRRECMMSEWEPWSLCSATCGKGIRMRSRVFRFPIKAQMFHCHRQTTERQFCNAKINECADSDAFNSQCAMTSWGTWGACSVICGHGTRSRNRTFLSPTATEEKCSNLKLSVQDICIGENGEDCSVTPDPLCKTTDWSEWSPCSASCDDGVRIRTRLFFFPEHELRCGRTKLMEKEQCTMQSCKRFLQENSEEICKEEKAEGQCKGVFPKYWFNHETGQCERFIYTGCKGNRNQFTTSEECKRACIEGYEADHELVPNHQLVNEFGDAEVNDGGDPVKCEMTEWSPWGQCSATCGHGKRIRTRAIKIFPRNGGTPCPEHLVQEHHCLLMQCPRDGTCLVGQWTRWSSCSVSCGEGIQFRRRRVLQPMDGQSACNHRDRDERTCRIPCRQ